MKHRVICALAVLAALVLGTGCALSSHSSIYKTYTLSTDGETGRRTVEAVAEFTKPDEMTLFYLTLEEDAQAVVDCSLARNQERGNAALYYEDPEGERILLGDMIGEVPNPNTVTLKAGTGVFLVKADKGTYDVGMGLGGLAEENILYLKGEKPQE